MTVTGEGPHTLVFGHGLGGDQRSWRFIAPHFTDQYRVVLFDHVGCGGARRDTTDPRRYDRLDDYARDVLEILEELGLSDVTFVGHSMSGAVGLLAAIAAPARIARVALIASSPCFVNDPSEGYVAGFTAADIDGLLQLLETNFIGWTVTLGDAAAKDAAYGLELRTGLGALEPENARRLAEVVFRADVRSALDDVEQPVLIVQCERDDIAPASVGEYMHAHLAKSTLRRIDVAGHCPQLSDPGVVEAALRDFLRDEGQAAR